jgi:hypothetical protein
VNASHRRPAGEDAELIHLIALMRHNKVTY